VRTAVTAAVIALIASVASGNVRAYAIDPVRAEWSGKAHPVLGVSEVLTCNYDSLAYVELFAGDSGSTGSGYRVGVWEGGVELTYATGVQHQPASWVRFDNWNTQVAFTKGKQYEVRFTRSGSDSIQFYYQGGNPALSDPYSWGWMRVGGTDEVCMDLCARVYGHPKVGGQAIAAA
jgi:hypothetical protein